VAATSRRSSEKFLDHTTPSARVNVASRLSLDRASSPPPAEEGSRLRQLLNHSAIRTAVPQQRRGYFRRRSLCYLD